MGFKRSRVRISPARFLLSRVNRLGSIARVAAATGRAFESRRRLTLTRKIDQFAGCLVPGREISDDFFETRVAAQRVPRGVKLEVAVAEAARNSQGRCDLLEREVFLAAPGID